MAIRTLLIDPEDVLYTRPNAEANLYAFLEAQGIKPRHPQMVQKALKAAYFDVLHGRITCDVYHNALLDFHGVKDDTLLQQGREALQADAGSLSPMLGAVEALQQLCAAEIELAIIMNTGFPGHDIVKFLEDAGFGSDLWSEIIVSSEIEHTLPDPALIDAAMDILETQPAVTAVLSAHMPVFPMATQYGLTTIGFRLEKDSMYVHHSIRSFNELVQLFTTP